MDYETNRDYKYGWMCAIHIETKIHAPSFLNLHDKNLNSSSAITLEMVLERFRCKRRSCYGIHWNTFDISGWVNQDGSSALCIFSLKNPKLLGHESHCIHLGFKECFIGSIWNLHYQDNNFSQVNVSIHMHMGINTLFFQQSQKPEGNTVEYTLLS